MSYFPTFLRLVLSLTLFVVLAQPVAHAQTAPAEFTGAVAEKTSYSAVYQLDSDDPKLIKMALRNMKNALEDPRLKGKLHLELVVFGGGTVVFRKDQPYETELRALQQQGVLLAQCLNSIKALNLSKDQLFPFVSYVPTGNGELIIRQQQGWALVHP